jgi:hypothetical protein
LTSNIVQGLKPLAVPLSSLTLLENNPRKGDVDVIMQSYERFGQRKPVVALKTGVDKKGNPVGTVLAGNHQFMAVKRMGWDEIACVFVEDDDQTASAYAIADNRVGLVGEWDVEKLLDALTTFDDELLTATGFDEDDIDDLSAELEEIGMPELPKADPGRKVDADTKVGRDLSYNEFLERYAARSTRGLVLEYQIEEFKWVTENLGKYREKFEVETNAEALVKMLAVALGIPEYESEEDA